MDKRLTPEIEEYFAKFKQVLKLVTDAEEDRKPEENTIAEKVFAKWDEQLEKEWPDFQDEQSI